jgi:hypothetical protein
MHCLKFIFEGIRPGEGVHAKKYAFSLRLCVFFAPFAVQFFYAVFA